MASGARGARSAVAVLAIVACAGVLGPGDAPPARSAGPRVLRIGAPGRLIAPSFLGMSVEWDTLAAWVGQDPARADQALGRMWGLLATDGSPVLRIGGDSADRTWIGPARPPRDGIQHVIGPGLLPTFGAVLRRSPARVVVDLDLAHRRFGADARVLALARAALPARDLRGVEVGNEPDLYATHPWARVAGGGYRPARGPHYGVGALVREYRTALRVLARPLRGLSLAGPGLGSPAWTASTPAILRRVPRIAVVAAHQYSLSRCAHRARPTLDRLLAPAAVTSVLRGVRLEQRAALARGLPLRLEEAGSVACHGAGGVSDAPASALWGLRLLFTMAAHGVSGVDLHNAQGPYDQLVVRRAGTRWTVHAQPTFYAMLAFAHALRGPTRLLHVSGPRGVLAWATRDATGTVHVVLVDVARRPRSVVLATGRHGRAGLLRLLPGADSTFGGRGFGTWTAGGRLAPALPEGLPVRRGRARIRLSGRSAVVVDLPPAQKSLRPARCSSACGRVSS